MKLFGFLLLAMTGLTICAAESVVGPPPEKVPGVVISHYPSTSGCYVGSPSIAILPNGAYVASHDLFGPKSAFNGMGQTKVFRSEDRGCSWRKIADVYGSFWSTLFVHRGALYLIGTSRGSSDVIIRRSNDGGISWSEAKDGSTGILSEGAKYHCAPVPVIVHNGRIWRAMESCKPRTPWGVKFRAGMLSAPVDSDLLNRESWTFSNFLPSDTSWINGSFGGWLEGNAVVTPDGDLVNILRVETRGCPEKAAVVRISDDGKLAWFDPLSGFINMPGGAKKFTIRYDRNSGLYWALVNDVHAKHRPLRPARVRNMLSLACSEDLSDWSIRCNLLHHPDVTKHGFQYIDWQLDGDDIIAVSRTAYDDDASGAHNMHDANYLTFHRVKKFRNLTMQDSVPFYGLPSKRIETENLVITGYGWSLAGFKEKGTAYANREYHWFEVPEKLKKGWQFTRMSGGKFSELAVEAKQATTLQMFTALGQKVFDLNGWAKVEGRQFRYTDKNRTLMQVYQRKLEEGQTLYIPQGNWTGCMLLLPEDARSAQGAEVGCASNCEL